MSEKFYGIMHDEINSIEDELQAACDDLHKHLASVSCDEFIRDSFNDYQKYFDWKLVTSFKFRKCLVSGKPIYPGTKAYKGTLVYEHNERVVWVVKKELLFHILKKDFNAS